MSETPPEVQRLRKRIEELDARLLQTLAERFRAVEELSRWKRGYGLPVEDAERERQLVELHERSAKVTRLDPRFVERLFRTVLEESKERQRDALRSRRA